MPLNVFQIIVLPIMAFLFVERAAAVARGKIPRRVAFFWMCVWLFGGIAVAFPDATSAIARPLGIARGADLVFYLAILFMLVGFYMMYVRLRRLDANITHWSGTWRFRMPNRVRLRMTQPKSAGKSSKAQPI
jgi:hypothetical protein